LSVYVNEVTRMQIGG